MKLSTEAYKDTVAFIKTDHGRVGDGPPNTTAGTGFFVTKDGVLATDYHVVKDAKAGITVTTSNGVVHFARIKSIDIKSDLALLQVDPVTLGETFQPAKLAESSQTLDVNEPVFTLGHPKRSKESRLSLGTKNDSVPLSSFSLTDGFIDGEDPNRRVITTLMAAESGNSGGPIVRASDGEVVAIVDFNSLSNTMAISTPVEDLHRLLARSGLAQRNNGRRSLSLHLSQPTETPIAIESTQPAVRQFDAAGQPAGQKDKDPAALLRYYSTIRTLPQK